jgi:hypothetical protein
MDDDSDFVTVPPEAEKFVGTRLPGTRIYDKRGPMEEAQYWHEAVMNLVGDAVSPGGVAMYAPVSRAAVHRRIKDGKMTAFYFHQTEEVRRFWGQTKVKHQLQICYIPVSEAKSWGQELKERAIKEGRITREELEGAKPDWVGDFQEWDSRWKKGKRKHTAKEANG